MDSRNKLYYILERVNVYDRIILNIPEKTYMCGRARENEIVCLSLTVSRKHCTFFFSGGELFVTDLQSANGLFLNGVLQRPYETIKLQQNDIVGIGCSDINGEDNTMFAYKVYKFAPSQLQNSINKVNKNAKNSNLKDNDNANNFPQARQTFNNEPLADLYDGRFDALSKRKRETNSDEMNTVPNKIPKLNSEELEGIIVKGDHKTTDENDIEIVHISLNNSVPQQSNNNCNNASRCIASEKKLNISKVIDTDMFEVNHGKKDQLETLKKIECDEFVSSKDVQSLAFSNTNNDKKEEEPLIVNKNTERLNLDTCRDGQKSTDSELSDIKDKENSHNSCNIPHGSKKRDNYRRVKTTKENADSISHKSSKCSSKFHAELNKIENGEVEKLLLPPNFIQNGDTVIKLENELQLTDTDEEAIWNSSNTDFTPLVSPIKLKKVQQEPKTKFSEVDVVNLSDSEDDIFPCSQLFDIGFGNDVSVKEEVKEEPMESGNGTFNALDDADLVISLSDSEDEDSTWLRRLSRSQLLNESDETRIHINDCKEEVMVVEIIDIEEPLRTLNTVEDKFQLLADIKDETIKQEGIDKFMHEDEKEEKEDKSLQDVRKANEMHLLGSSTERMVVDSEDDDMNIMKLFTSPVSNRKSILSSKPRLDSTKESLDSKKQNTENHVDISDNSITEETSTVECAPSTSSKKMKKLPEKKVPEIEPPHLPVRRRSHSSTRSKEVPEKPAQKKPTAKELKEEERRKQYFYEKDQKNRRQRHKWADCLPLSKNKPTTSFTKEEKKEIADKRKERLKKISMNNRPPVEGNQEKKRISTKPIAKVSTKTRFDVLVEDTLSASKPDESTEKPGPSSSRSTLTNNASANLKATERKKYKDPSKDITARLQNSLTLTDPSSLGKIPKKNSNAKEKADSAAKAVSEDAILTKAMKEGLDIGKKETDLRNKSMTKSSADAKSPPCYKSNLKSSTSKPKKQVAFSTISVHMYEIDESNVLKKLYGKDAPLPRAKTCRNKPGVMDYTKRDEFLQRIFMWHPVWLEEQQHLESIPPVIRPDEYHPTLTRYKSYDDYYKIIAPLLLLETWSGITKEIQNIKEDFRRRTLMCSTVANSIQRTKFPTNVYFTSLMVEALLTREDVQRQAYPCSGDLLVFEYVKQHEKVQSFSKVFAYVQDMYQTPLTPMTHYNKDLQTYVRNPYMLITYTMYMKPLDQNIPVNRVQRLRAVYNLRSTIRQVLALGYLPCSPVADLILNPRIDTYNLPSVSSPEPLITKDKLNPKQSEAVSKVTEAIVQKKSKLCFIQGPPGTGKSTVIVNIVTQVLYGNDRYTDNGGSLRILVCAPSNAAIDEITLRLLNIRSTMTEKRFKMVRIGRTDMMHPSVRRISVTQLADHDVKKMNSIPSESAEEELSRLESKMNALRCELNTSSLDETYKKHLRMKLTDIMAKYDLLKHRRPLGDINPRVFKKLQRAAEDRVLSHADIITCTLASCYNHQMESVFVSSKKRISVCIVDEATQSCEPETLIPLMLGVNTLVLVGDPMQLPATVLSQKAKQLGLNQSIFARVQSAFELQPNNPIIMLDTQYRMQRDIASWPNKFFYGAKLKTAVVQNGEFPFYPYRILNIHTNQHNENNSNIDEAQFVANMVFSMLTYANLDNWESLSFGILSPYNDQKPVIQKEIEDKMAPLPENVHKKVRVEVNTVDGFQGQERDIIIMSCVRSQKIGFLSDRQRLCVALTRAKHCLILCGNFNVFMKDELWKTLLSDARNRRVYFDVKAKAKPQEIKRHVIKRAKQR